MCGIVCIVDFRANHYELWSKIQRGMRALQHRGYDGFGLAYEESRSSTTTTKAMTLTTSQGQMPANLHQQPSTAIAITMAMGHTRYRTSGSLASMQPVWSGGDLYLIHNGHVVCSDSSSHVKSSSSSDSQQIVDFLAKQPVLDIQALQAMNQRFRGSYSCVLYDAKTRRLLAFRDPYGIRPLVIGHDPQRRQVWSFASETVALTAMGHEFYDEVQPGEMVIVDAANGWDLKRASFATESARPCLFEYIYLAHKDSVLNGISVLEARQGFGRSLARRPELQAYKDNPNTAVIPVPKTSNPAAKALAQSLNVRHCKPLKRKKSKGRSFILSSQEKRQMTVESKFQFDQDPTLQGKTLILVDDSIVRGTTMQYIVRKIREHYKPQKICVVSIAPPLIYPNFYGIDIPTKQELIAVKHRGEVAEALGADQIVYQKLSAMLRCLQALNPQITSYETSVFDGQYLYSDS
jgi:amidophosphoribosyltransferase